MHTREVPFLGGPYDGLILTLLEIDRLDLVIRIRTTRGLRRFIFLPYPDAWPDIVDSRLSISLAEGIHHSELVEAAKGPEFRFDHRSLRFKQAVSEGV